MDTYYGTFNFGHKNTKWKIEDLATFETSWARLWHWQWIIGTNKFLLYDILIYHPGLGDDSDYVAGSQRPVSILSAGYASSKHTEVHHSHVEFADGDKCMNTERPPYTDTEISDYYPS